MVCRQRTRKLPEIAGHSPRVFPLAMQLEAATGPTVESDPRIEAALGWADHLGVSPADAPARGDDVDPRSDQGPGQAGVGSTWSCPSMFDAGDLDQPGSVETNEASVGEVPVQIDVKDVSLRTCLALIVGQ